MNTAHALWRRLDTPGHDACRLARTDGGWTLDGSAVFRDDEGPSSLTYHVACDLAWQTERGHVHGWLGHRLVEFDIARTSVGVWTLNGVDLPDLGSCVDLDLGFTPATNLTQLRRVELAEGQAADVPVAWLDATARTLTVLPQRYERQTRSTYWYEAPTVGYEGVLEVDSTGFILRYPDLWEAER